MTKQKFILGNWKMNNQLAEIEEFTAHLTNLSQVQHPDLYLGIAPMSPYLSLVRQKFPPFLHVGAQNISTQKKGAFTGEIPASTVSELKGEFVLVGHSERRSYFHETSSELAEKIRRAFEERLLTVFCVGETLKEREEKSHFDCVKKQMNEVIELLGDDAQKILSASFIMAYEPVWAIGTGKVASAKDAEEMHAFISSLLKEKWGNEFFLPILYGGSVTAQNINELLAMPNISGALVGGASLKSDSFSLLAQAAFKFF